MSRLWHKPFYNYFFKKLLSYVKIFTYYKEYYTVKNHHLSFIKITAFLFCGVFALITGLTSCENFMNGQDVQKDYMNSLAYNNAPSCKVYLKAEHKDGGIKYGDFLSGTEKEFKIGYEAVIQFEVNSLEYVFKGFKAYNLDETESRDDLVEFTKAEDETSRDIYKYKVKIIKKTDDIVIRPECTPLPKIKEVTPKFESGGCDQDKPIKIFFNNSMDLESFGDFSCISISSDNDLKDYFEKPVREPEYLIVLCFKSVCHKSSFLSDGGHNSHKGQYD